MIVNLVVVLIPLGSIYFLNIYENELVHQTESELIAQGTVIAAAYKNEIQELLNAKVQMRYGIPLKLSARSTEHYRPIPALLDLANVEILTQRPDGLTPPFPSDALAINAGIRLTPILQEAQRTTLAGAQIMDYRGIVVSGVKETGLSFIHLPEIQKALDGEYASSLRKRVVELPEPPLSGISRSNTIRVFVALPVMLNNRLIGAVLLSRSPRSIVKALYDSKSTIIIAAFILISLASLLALFTSYTITRPIYALIAQTKGIIQGRIGAANIPLRHPVTQEIALLSESFSRMAETVEHRSNYIRNFAMHVSHEFKTPLTSIQGAIELLQEHMHEMPTEKRDKFLNNIALDTEKLKKLVDRLLELARADVFEPSLEATEVETDQAINGALSGYWSNCRA